MFHRMAVLSFALLAACGSDDPSMDSGEVVEDTWGLLVSAASINGALAASTVSANGVRFELEFTATIVPPENCGSCDAALWVWWDESESIGCAGLEAVTESLEVPLGPSLLSGPEATGPHTLWAGLIESGDCGQLFDPESVLLQESLGSVEGVMPPDLQVVSTEPAGSLVDPDTATIGITFDEEIDASTASNLYFSFSGPSGPLPVTTSVSGATVTLQTDALEFATLYTATAIPGFTSVTGLELGSPHEWRFTTRGCAGIGGTSVAAGPVERYGFCWYLGEAAATCDETCADTGMSNAALAAANAFPDSCSAAGPDGLTTHFFNNGNPAGWTGAGGSTSARSFGYGYANVGTFYGKCASSASEVGAWPGEVNEGTLSEERQLVCACQ